MNTGERVRFGELLDRYLDEAATPDEIGELDDFIVGHPDAVVMFVSATRNDAALADYFGDRIALDSEFSSEREGLDESAPVPVDLPGASAAETRNGKSAGFRRRGGSRTVRFRTSERRQGASFSSRLSVMIGAAAMAVLFFSYVLYRSDDVRSVPETPTSSVVSGGVTEAENAGRSGFSVTIRVHVTRLAGAWIGLATRSAGDKILDGIWISPDNRWTAGGGDGAGNGAARKNIVGGYVTVGWHDLALVEDPDHGRRLYVNGVLAAAGMPLCINTSDGGWATCGGDDYAAGGVVVSEFRLYPTTLAPGTLPAGRDVPDDDRLIAYWSFEKGPDPRVVRDLTGNGHDGRITGAPQFVAGVFGSALEFDGVGDYVMVPNATGLSFGPEDSISISAWVRVMPDTVVPGKFSGIVTRGRETKNWSGIWIAHSGRWAIGCKTIGRFNIYGPQVLPGWRHVVLVKDGAVSLTLYVDGVPVASGETVGVGDEGHLMIGAAGGRREFFRGAIDEVKVFGVALGRERIDALFQRERPDGETMPGGSPPGDTDVSK